MTPNSQGVPWNPLGWGWEGVEGETCESVGQSQNKMAILFSQVSFHLIFNLI